MLYKTSLQEHPPTDSVCRLVFIHTQLALLNFAQKTGTLLWFLYNITNIA